MCRMSRNYYHYLHIRRYTTFFLRWIYKSRNKVLNLPKKNVYPSISLSNSCCYCYFIREKLCKSIITAKLPSEPKAYFFPHRLFIILSPLRPLSAPAPLSPHHKSPFVGNSSSSPPGNYRSRDFSSAPLRATEALPYRPSGGGRHNDYFAVRKIDVAVLHFPVFFSSLFLIC